MHAIALGECPKIQFDGLVGAPHGDPVDHDVVHGGMLFYELLDRLGIRRRVVGSLVIVKSPQSHQATDRRVEQSVAGAGKLPCAGNERKDRRRDGELRPRVEQLVDPPEGVGFPGVPGVIHIVEVVEHARKGLLRQAFINAPKRNVHERPEREHGFAIEARFRRFLGRLLPGAARYAKGRQHKGTGCAADGQTAMQASWPAQRPADLPKQELHRSLSSILSNSIPAMFSP